MQYPMEMLQSIVQNDTFLYFGNQREKRIYARYLSYKAIQAIYALRSQSTGDNKTWQTYRQRFAHDQRLRHTAQSVINDTLCVYAKNGFPFRAIETKQGKKETFQQAKRLYAQALPISRLRAISLYDSEQEEVQTIHYFFLLMEIAYYADQLQCGKHNTWKDYLTALRNNLTMRQTLCFAFYHALRNVDFTDGWVQATKQTENHLLFP